MGLKQILSNFWWLDDEKPIRSLAEDLLTERENQMLQDLKEMEEKLKRHITECKREIIKELQGFIAELKSKPPTKKEVKNVRQS